MSKFVEELTLNTWPAKQSVLMQGWILRTSVGYTKRANSVSPLYAGETSREVTYGLIRRAEAYYSAAGLAPVFKITPYTEPSELDALLEEQEYIVVEPSGVRIREIGEQSRHTAAAGRTGIVIRTGVDEDWLGAFARLSNLTDGQLSSLRTMLSASVLPMGCALTYVNGVPAACGLGVIQEGYLVLYDIVTRPEYRRQGLASGLIGELMSWGAGAGAAQAVLQVVLANSAAGALYDRLGFREIYTYWYRVKP